MVSVLLLFVFIFGILIDESILVKDLKCLCHFCEDWCNNYCEVAALLQLLQIMWEGAVGSPLYYIKKLPFVPVFLFKEIGFESIK